MSRLFPAEPRLAAVAGGVALGVTLPGVCRTLSLMGDSAAFTAAAASWGVAQPPGYPLWTLLGHAASRLPLGELAFRIHLTSALYHAAAVGLVAALIQKCTGSRGAALGGALFLAFSRAFFQGSHYAEVFPLNDLFGALLLLLGVVLVERPMSRRALGALALLSGLAFAHHQTIALYAPGLAVLLWRGARRPRFEPRLFAALVCLFALPLVASSALLLLAARRDPAVSWGDVRSPGELFQLVTRGDYGGLFSPYLGERGAGASEQIVAYGASLWRQLGLVGVGLALCGMLTLGRRLPVVALGLGLAALVSGPAFAVLNALPVADEHGIAFAERFVTLSLVPLGVFCGSGMQRLGELGSVVLPPRFASALAGGLALLPLAQHHDAVDLSDDRCGAAFAADLFEHSDDGALVLVSGDFSNGAAAFWCGVERRCGRRIVLAPGQLHLPWRVRQLARRHPELVIPEPSGSFVTVREIVAANLSRRPVYLMPLLLEREPPLRESFGYLPEGLLLRVVPKEPDEPARARFRASAQRLLRGEGCAGCAMRRSDLPWPSLETAMLQSYVDAAVNHARLLRLFFDEVGLAEELEARARAMDPEAARRYLSP